MPLFSRSFASLRRMFPASGVSVPHPSEITDSVQLTHELTKATFVNSEMRFRRQVVSAVMAAGDNTVDLLEPDPGFIQFPMLLNVEHDDGAATNRIVSAAIIISANPPDVWGGWETGNRHFGGSNIRSRLGAPGGSTWLQALDVTLPMTRGFFYQIHFLSMLAGTTARVHYYYLDVPGEFVTADMILSRGTQANGAGKLN